MKIDITTLNKSFSAFIESRNMPYLKLGDLISDEGKFSSVYNLYDGKRELALKVISTKNTPVSETGKALEYARGERDAMLACQNYRFQNIENCFEWEYTMRLLDYFEFVADENDDIIIFFVMPKLMQLKDYCEYNNLSEQEIIMLVKDIACALDICEKNKILHRDVKPSNIFVKLTDDGIRFILGDFGVAREINDSAEPVTGIGSFKAPELFFSKPLKGFNSDIYSLGMTLYFLTTGDYAIAASKKMPPERFCPELRSIMIRCSEYDPEKRYSHAYEIIEELSEYEADNKEYEDAVDLAARCKCLLLDREFEKCIALAEQGYKNGDIVCTNIYAYAYYCLHGNDPVRLKYVMNILRESIRKNDNTARCLFSLIGLRTLQNDLKADEAGNYKRLMQFSAQNGCVIAQYYYGRWVFDGQMGFASDSKEGMKYLMMAVNKGFAPALLYIKTRIEHKDRRFEYSDDMIRMLHTELQGFDKSKIAEAVVLAI